MYAIDVRQTDRRQTCIIALICARPPYGDVGIKSHNPTPRSWPRALLLHSVLGPSQKKSYTHHWRHGRPMYVAVSICFNGFLLK